MKKILSAFLALFLAAGCLSAKEAAVVSPSGKFRIVQRCDEGDKWTSRVVFKEPGKRAVTLNLQGVGRPSGYYISPDERWIFRLQRMDTGGTKAILYYVQPDGKIFAVNPPFSDRAWQYYEDHTRKKDKLTLSHKGVIFNAWEPDALVFTLSGVKEGDHAHDIRDDKFRYDFAKEKFSRVKKPDY